MYTKFNESYIGTTHYHLTILEKLPKSDKKMVMVICQCVCGKKRPFKFSKIIARSIKSCGCTQRRTVSLYWRYK